MRKIRVASVFGTRPETIKMAPVLRELAEQSVRFDSQVILTSQHTSLIAPLLEFFGIKPHIDLNILKAGQSLDELLGRLVVGLGESVGRIRPDVILVQGDTTSALAGALVAHHHQIPLFHVEAGLRSGNRYSPFPEEMNRRLVTQLATHHLAATQLNVDNLMGEGIAANAITLTGNPVVDSLQIVLKATQPSAAAKKLIDDFSKFKVITLTTHRRENFGNQLQTYMRVLSDFVYSHPDTALIFPVHPNPAVVAQCHESFRGSDRIRLVPPMNYPDFLHILKSSWLIASDSGGIQEEAPSLGVPLLILRHETERPEVVACGAAKLVGDHPENLMQLLEESYRLGAWVDRVGKLKNPFGDGDAAKRIVARIGVLLGTGV